MLFATTVLALAMLAPSAPTADTAAHRAPSAPCVAPAHTGTFRVTTRRADGTDPRPAMIVLENIDGCLEATFVTDEVGPAIIDHLSASNRSLEGALKLGTGTARVTLDFDGAQIAGSIMQGRQSWKLEGRKTS